MIYNYRKQFLPNKYCSLKNIRFSDEIICKITNFHLSMTALIGIHNNKKQPKPSKSGRPIKNLDIYDAFSKIDRNPRYYFAFQLQSMKNIIRQEF